MSSLTQLNRKKCSCCKGLKPLTEFSKNRSTPDGLAYYCRPCNQEKQRQWKHDNPELADKYRGRVRMS